MSEPKYPKGEYVWNRYYNVKSELMFIMTAKRESRDFYYLYELEDGVFKKLGKSKSPPELERKFRVDERLRK